MPIIDATYFTGELSIPNTDKDYVLARLNEVITLREDEFLQRVLGYSMYKPFIEAAFISPVEQRWQDVILGKEFTNLYSNKVQKWPGLIQSPSGVTLPLTEYQSQSVVVGRGQTYDPLAGASSATIPPAFRNTPIIIEQRGFGRLRPDEYSITSTVDPNDTLNLLAWTFTNGDTYFYTSPISVGLPTLGAGVLKSCIANYVYYYWMRDTISITTGVGEANMLAENASRQSHAYKMVRAWNEMAAEICLLRDYFEANKTTYPEWDYTPYYKQAGQSGIDSLARPINLFGI